MANLRSTKKGRGKFKKSLTGQTIDTVMGNSDLKLKNVENSPLLQTSRVTDVKSTDSYTLSRGIITRSGRIRKKSKDDLKAMDEILKSELMIDVHRNQGRKSLPDPPIINGINNNNDIAITNQNNTNTVSVVDRSDRISLKRQRKRNVTNVQSLDCNRSPSNSKIRVTRNIFNDSEANNQVTSTNNVENKTSEDIVKSNPKKQIYENSVNSVNVPENKKSLVNGNTKKNVRKRTRSNKSSTDQNPKENIGKRKKQKVDSTTTDGPKKKQVRLSNGVVLTLSLLQCDHCQKCFSNKASLARHMFAHFDLKPHRCHHCPRKFRHRSTLKVHFEKCHPNASKSKEIHPCQICDKTFQLQENLELHLASHVKTENNFKCIYCEKKFSYRLLLLQHEKTHNDSGCYKCYMCEMSYATRSRLSHHMRIHSKIKDYICHHCGKGFKRLNSIKRHVKVCHGGHRVQCPICRKELKGHLTEHMRVHDQNKPHECVDCGQRFTQSTQLKVHRRSHTGDRPYDCRICNRAFSHSNALMLHIRRHTGEKPFPCPMCPLTFSQLPHMKCHMRKIHGKDGAYKCEKCYEFFKMKADLVKHSKTCNIEERELSFEEKIQASVCSSEEVVVESATSLSKMRFQLALLLTMIATKDRLKYLGFNKRLIDEILEESLEGMGHEICNDESLSPFMRLKNNIETLLIGTIPKRQMQKFRSENKSTEELLELLTDEKKKD